MDKYYQILGKVLSSGKMQSNKKGNIRYLLNEQLTLLPADLLDIFEGHTIARKKLKNELQLFMRGERNVEKYREAGINWWDYCGSILVNSYPTYFENCTKVEFNAHMNYNSSYTDMMLYKKEAA